MAKPSSIRQIKTQWDNLATLNAEHFIESSRETWDINDFIRSGQDDVKHLLLPVLTEKHLDPAHLRVLDFGCGVGRLSQALAQYFKLVTAIDVSEQMISKGKATFGHIRNIDWVSYDGYDLSFIGGQSHDVVFSYIVLQHVPDERLALHYLEEMCRVIAPSGLLHVQFSYRSLYRMRRLYCGIRAKLAQNDLIYRTLYKRWSKRRYGREELINMLSIMQHSLSPKRVTQVIISAGLQVVKLDCSKPSYSWITARRPPV